MQAIAEETWNHSQMDLQPREDTGPNKKPLDSSCIMQELYWFALENVELILKLRKGRFVCAMQCKYKFNYKLDGLVELINRPVMELALSKKRKRVSF